MDDVKLESMILDSLSSFTPIWSNELHRKLGVNKADYTRVKNKMIEEGWIRSEKREGRHYLSRIDFESSMFDRKDWNKYTLINCNSALESLKTQRPLFRITKKKGAKIKTTTSKIITPNVVFLDNSIKYKTINPSLSPHNSEIK